MRRNNKKLSSIIKDYSGTDSGRGSKIEISPNVLELSGIIKLDKSIDLRKVYGSHLEQKYLR